jgi:NAD+ kinase
MAMRVLLVFKKSFLESHAADRRAVAQLEAADRARLVKSDTENRRALADVCGHLARLGVPYDAVYRGSLARRRRYDLVVALGGDGTFFAAARYVDDTPILGINSDPANSLALWSCADRFGFHGPLEQALAGRLRSTVLHRMAIAVNGKALRSPALNDILFAHRNPAAMTRYRISANGRTEDQKSSGLWVSTASGSTAAIRSAGGVRMPVDSRRLQFLAREPYAWPLRRYRLARGFASRISITTFMVESAIWIDGSRVRLDLTLGDRVELGPGRPLRLLGFSDRRRRRLFP